MPPSSSPGGDAAPALVATNLSKAYGPTQALDSLELAIPAGRFFGLLGPNGAGKSTFMSIVSGFLQADSGELTLFGKTYAPQDPERKRLIGFTPQHIALYDEMTAEENLQLFAKLYGLPRKLAAERVDQGLATAQLIDRSKHLVKTFSGGMKRRLNIAASLLHKPRILLCDEPTVGVDPQSRNAIFDTLSALSAEGMTVLYSTHYMEEAEKLCDEIAIIDQGKILAVGDLDSLIDRLPAKLEIRCRRSALSPAQIESLAQFGQVADEKGEFSLLPDGDAPLSRFYAWTESERLDPRHFKTKSASLENLFLQLTGRDLRE